ncbi:leucyl/phenylalanyl-tRNA--protein transferase [Caenimonas koreensis]|uniref:Leucyl/phenylalanyl-tRNA--protein transferase n=1 Tax=Caenimonas koreensis DSM 17982 TaxID=1121255 RepID=A0A844B201_9BURK|nr:leucyl/phenylalanyl-tRNA--protein transferase [Caenimonas koreensis]MRD45739.1 leucyl/phenylalanyl-tRNA--protein transferase [Caenimonas koreensis DSM 17982]
MKLPWLEPGDPFPPASQAWDESEPAPGLLAAGGSLDVQTLHCAYSSGIFPWFSEGQPILWWSTHPRMVLYARELKLHRSLRKTIARFASEPRCEIRFDASFSKVIRACSASPRTGQSGTWIVPQMVRAYEAFHRAGFAHSVETWIDGELAGGLYCIVIGRAVFGESMFMRVPDASKIALAALCAWCRHHNIDFIDCQQNTRHLASLGGREIGREHFVAQVAQNAVLTAPAFEFLPVYWDELLPRKPTA